MRLVVLIGRFPPGVVGGAELQAEGWARRLAPRHPLIVVTRKNAAGDPDREERDGFAVVRLPVSRVPVLRAAIDVRRIERTVAAVVPKPDLLLCFQTFVSGYVGVRLQQRLGVPAVVWVRGEDEYRPTRARTRRISIGVWSRAAGVLVQGEGSREAVLAAVERFAPARRDAIAAKLRVVPNGIDLPPPPFARGAGVLAVGRLIPDKGMDVLLEAAARAGQRLTIAGDGPERGRLEARARQLALDVRFTGIVGAETLGRLYRDAACVALASRRGEGLPNAVLEAFAHARPVVATAVTGVTDLVRNESNGLTVPPGDAAALAAALARLEREPALAERLGAAARATAERFAWARVLAELDHALEAWRAR